MKKLLIITICLCIFLMGSDYALRYPTRTALEVTVPSDLDPTIISFSATTNITAAGGITVTKTLMRIAGDSGAIDITANPQIADGIDGQIVYIQGDHDTNTVKLDDGTGLQLAGGISFTLGQGDMIALIFDSGDDAWIEVSRSDN